MIHSSLIAQQSESLATLVNGPFREASEQCATWEHVDEDTFIRFSQFLYTGDYDRLMPQLRSLEEQPKAQITGNEGQTEGRVPSLEDRGFDCTGIPPPRHLCRNRSLWREFCIPKTWLASRLRRFEALDNRPNEDYSNVLISHAKVYVLADYHGIKELGNMALHNLRSQLMRYRLHNNHCVSDIVQLLMYCFHNTMDKGDQHDALRSLVCTYAALEVEVLWRSDEFQQLLDTLPEFAKALFSRVTQALE